MHCTGVILAGGGATRFGGLPKGLERVGGRRIIDRAADALRACTDELLLVANDPRASEWLPGVRVARDLRPGEGSLGGLHAALAHAPGAVLVVAWDMPFVNPALLRRLRALGESGFDAAVPESDSRRGVEPMCAWYAPPCLAAIEGALDRGDRRVVAFFDHVRVARLPAIEVAAFGDPAHLFLNVNTPDEHSRANAREDERTRRRGDEGAVAARPPLLTIVGKKNAGKTTLVVQLAAALRRRGVRVMTIKHGSHTFNLDPATTDTYRHFHEGEAERVAMISPDRFALVMRWGEELAPEEVAARFMGDADLVLCEGFKRSALPKIEIARRAAHPRALVEDGAIDAATMVALVTDAPGAIAAPREFDLNEEGWLERLADFVDAWRQGRGGAASA